MTAYGLNPDRVSLSKLFRLGSGSASRSIAGGFVKWQKGDNHDTSYAIPVSEWDDFRMIVCLISQKEKSISSSEAMQKTMEHPDYPLWIKKAETDLLLMEDALVKKDINQVGKIAQSNALFMHEMIRKVGIDYFLPETYELLEKVYIMQKHIPVYATMDAGPNVKLITLAPYVKEVERMLENSVPYVVCKSGIGLEILK